MFEISALSTSLNPWLTRAHVYVQPYACFGQICSLVVLSECFVLKRASSNEAITL